MNNDDIAQKNIINETRSFIYDLIRQQINNQTKDANGKRFFTTFFCRFQLWKADSHIKENIHNIYNEMIDAGFMELVEEDKQNGLHRFAITESGYIEVNGLNKKREEKMMKGGHTIIAGDGSKINIDSIDNSTSHLTFNNNQLEIFDKLKETIMQFDGHTEILSKLEDFEEAVKSEQDKTTVKQKFFDWLGATASVATIQQAIASYLPSLSTFF